MSRKSKYYLLHTDAAGEVTLVYAFSEEKYMKGIAVPKNIKAADIENVLVKQLNNLICSTNTSQKIRYQDYGDSMFNTILQPYRPISLLCHMHKLYDRLIHKKLQLLKDTSSRNIPVLCPESHAPTHCKPHSTHRG